MKNLARTSADFGFLPTNHLHRSQEVRMERRSCNDRLKPPPHRGQYSVAADTTHGHSSTGLRGNWVSVPRTLMALGER